jgi:hypothetical protein
MGNLLIRATFGGADFAESLFKGVAAFTVRLVLLHDADLPQRVLKLDDAVTALAMRVNVFFVWCVTLHLSLPIFSPSSGRIRRNKLV